MLLHDVAWRVEEYDRIVKRAEHQRNRGSRHADPAADQNETPLLASHRVFLNRMLGLLQQAHRATDGNDSLLFLWRALEDV